MKARFLLLLAALPFAALAQPYLPDAGPTAEQPTKSQLTPKQQLTQYRHDQINLLALHADPPSLLAAALLAEPDANDKTRPDVLKTPKLLERAQRFGADSALVWWVTAAIECKAKLKDCPSSDTLQKLEQLDAQNGAVWALALWRAQQAGDDITARATLTSAAQAKSYDDYFGALILTIYRAEGILPMSSELLNATGQDASVDGYRLTTAAAIAAALVQPENSAIMKACKHADSADSSLVEDCIQVARTMAAAGSMFTRQIGLAVEESMLSGGPAHDAAVTQVRTHAWRMQQIARLGGRLATDTRVTRTYLQALQASANESDAVDAVLRSQGVALEPPGDWQPATSESPPKP
ncbi:MAG: hypothetical protein ABI304_14545 [Rudaea sp.]